MTEYDTERIKFVLFIFGIIAVVTIIGIFVIRYEMTKEYREQCKNNPVLRYQTPCHSYDECITVCMARLGSGDSLPT